MQACLQSLQRCSLYFAKIVQTESRDASLLAIVAEVQPILCKVKKKYPFKQGCFKQGC